MSPKEVRTFAYEYAVYLKIKFPANWTDNKMTGEDWFSSFMKRHSKLSIRTPEANNLARALKKYMNSACDTWITKNSDKTLSIQDIPKLIATALPSAITHANITAGFQVAGISPFNKDIFSDKEFLPSLLPMDGVENVAIESNLVTVESNNCEEIIPGPSHIDIENDVEVIPINLAGRSLEKNFENVNKTTESSKKRHHSTDSPAIEALEEEQMCKKRKN